MAFGNVTIEPSAPATPVDKPQIKEVVDLFDGTIIDVETLICSFRYGDFVKERNKILEALKDGKPRYICALCRTPVYSVASTQKRFFFRHRSEDGSCPAQTRGELTPNEIRALKYQGLKESLPHKRIKNLLERSLRADKRFSAESIVQEKRWRSEKNPRQYRQPDVQASSNGLRFAFEVQLSTTFLDVVVGRRLFYRENNAQLIWILANFSPGYRRLTTDDLVFSNNANVFVIDEETTRISEESGEFHLCCHYLYPENSDGNSLETWKTELVKFTNLTIDPNQQLAYFYDYEGNRDRLHEEVDSQLRENFFEFWSQVNPHFDGNPDGVSRWTQLRREFLSRKIVLPVYPGSDSSFRSMVHGLLSAERGEPVGWRHHTLIQVAHNLAQSHPQHLLAFGFALKLSGHDQILSKQDQSLKWAKKREKIKQEIRIKNPNYLPDPRWFDALLFLFPAVGDQVVKFLTPKAHDGPQS